MRYDVTLVPAERLWLIVKIPHRKVRGFFASLKDSYHRTQKLLASAPAPSDIDVVLKETEALVQQVKADVAPPSEEE